MKVERVWLGAKKGFMLKVRIEVLPAVMLVMDHQE